MANYHRYLPSDADEFAARYEDVSALMEALEDEGIEGDQDWDFESTTWTFEDGSEIRINGQEVEVR